MIHSIREIYKDLWAFLKKPVEQKDPIQTWKHIAKRFFVILLIDILLMSILMPLLLGLGKMDLVDFGKNKILMLFQLPIEILVILGVIMIPLIEELFFRLYLRFRHNLLAQLIILLTSITGKPNKIKVKTHLANFWTNQFRAIFYFSAIVFGLVHLSNYDYSVSLFLVAPLLVAPQFIVGLFLGYLRVKHNVMVGFFFHAIHNTIFLIIPLFFMDQTIEMLNINNKDYSLKIEQSLLKKDLDSSISHKGNESSFKETSLKSMIASLLDKDEMLIESNEPLKVMTIINVNFINHKNDFSNNNKILLKNLSQVYGFHIENTKRLEATYELCLLDSLTLIKHRTIISKNPSYTGFASISPDSLLFKNVDLGLIAKKLTEKYKKPIINNTNFAGNYDLMIPVVDFNELEKLLNTKGLTLKKKLKELEYTNIHFIKAE
ncbi:MAG: lysostaphin resistance A-like protein [Aquirufa sp.]